MIQITNSLGLPLPLVTWLMNDDYDYNSDPKVFSATSLIKSTKKTLLSSSVARSNTIAVTIDVADKMAAIRGQNIHAAVEDSYADEAFVAKIANQLKEFVPVVRMEERLHAQIEIDGVEYTVSGKFDALINGVMTDWKTENTFSFGDETKERDRIMQLSIYIWLCVKNGIEVDMDKATYYSVYQNWMKGFAEKADESKYPKAPIMPFDIKPHSMAYVEMWLKDRIRERIELTIEDVDGMTCSPDDLWMEANPEWQYFSKPDAARASKNFPTRLEAETYFASKKHVGLIKPKPSYAKACEYCFGFAICSQYQRLKAEGKIQNERTAIPVSSSI